ncbi:MAG: flagellar hook-basal body complex protein [Rhodocyclales bacterium]|nr:flagellar hook-basal body complex protein [Rhodocyclales bacterium]
MGAAWTAATGATVGVNNFSGTSTSSYTASTAQTVYDSLGNAHNLTMYFLQSSQANTWQVYTALDGTFTGTPTTTAASSGALTGTAFADFTNANNGGYLNVTIDGTAASVYVPANPNYTMNTLATALQAAIDTAFPTTPSATVTVANGAITITSDTTGGSSSVTVAAGSTVPALDPAIVFGGTGSISAGGVFTGVYAGGSADLGGSISVSTSTQTAMLTVPAAAYADAAAYAAALQTAANAAFGANVIAVSEAAGVVSIDTVVSGDIQAVTAGTAHTLALADVLGSATPTATPGAAAATTTTPTPTTLSFTSAGALSTTDPISLSFDLVNGATTPLAFTLDFSGSSQYGLTFGVNQLLQDGFTSGRLSGISVSTDGVIQGRYSNGKSRNMGQVVLANFNNANGLQSLGDNQWAETVESGQAIPGEPGSGNLGVIQSASIEESNVDLTAELVNMITQQRVYQANAQSIKTQDQILQTLVNLR